MDVVPIFGEEICRVSYIVPVEQVSSSIDVCINVCSKTVYLSIVDLLHDVWSREGLTNITA